MSTRDPHDPSGAPPDAPGSWRAERQAPADAAAAEVRRRSDEEILAAHPPAAVAAEIGRRLALAEARARAARARRAPVWLLATVGAAAALLLLVTREGGRAPGLVEAPETIGLKGDRRAPSLRIYRKSDRHPDGYEPVGPGIRVRGGDLLQVRYLSEQRRYGVIASVDAQGTLTWHLPEAPGPAAPLEHELERAVPHAFELDGTPGFERFVFVTADQPFATDVVARLLKDGTPLPPALSLTSQQLQKETP